MRGSDERAGSLFSYVDLAARVRPDHPLRPIREIANIALADLTQAFDRFGWAVRLFRALMENRCGLAVDGEPTLATGTAERDATLTLLDRRLTGQRATLGVDKAGACPRAGDAGSGNAAPFVNALLDREVTPRIAANGFVSKTNHRRRKQIDKIFGWIKSSVDLTKVKLRGRGKWRPPSPSLQPPDMRVEGGRSYPAPFSQRTRRVVVTALRGAAMAPPMPAAIAPIRRAAKVRNAALEAALALASPACLAFWTAASRS